MGRLDSKVVVVTGAARGIGAAIARMCAAEGAKVALGDVLREQGNARAREIRESGGEAIFLPLDVSVQSDWTDALDQATGSFGPVTGLVNNAGVLVRCSMEELSESGFEQTMAVNVKGAFFGIKTVIPSMREAGGGSIINISSTSGLAGSKGGYGLYAASKGAIRLLSKNVAIEYAAENIRCNSIHPGPIETDMIADMLEPEAWAERVKALPLGRVGKPEDVGYAVIYLASHESRYVTGAEFVVDGGTTAQ